MAKIPEEIIRQVIDQTDIIELVQSYYPLKRIGKNYKTNCPFHHEKTPSFIVASDKQIFKCFGCGIGGTAIDFIMLQEHITFPEAIRFLANKLNILIDDDQSSYNSQTSERQLIFEVNAAAAEYYHKILLSDKTALPQQAREYLKKRGVDLETAKTFSLGFSQDSWDGLISYLRDKNISLGMMEKSGLIVPKSRGDGYYDRFRGRIMFPIMDTRSHCRAFGARAMEQSQESAGVKYINSPETFVYTKGHHLYGFHLAKDAVTSEDSVVIVEGYMDCIIPFQAGVKNIVASLGTALTVDQVRLIRRYTKNVVMLYDADQAGQSAMLRSLDMLIEEGMDVRIATLTEGHDPDTYVRQFGVDAFKDRIRQAATLFDYKLKALMTQHGNDSTRGKAKIVAEMLPTIYRFPDAVEKSEYRRKLAKILDVSEQILITEYQRIGEELSHKISKKIQEPDAVVASKIRKVERDILKLLLEEQKFVEKTKQEVTADHFQDGSIKEIILKIYDMFEKGQSVDAANLINSFEDQSMKKLITEIVVDENADQMDKEKMHADFISRIKADRNRLVRQELISAMRQAEMAQDHEQLKSLKLRFNQLIQES